MPVEKIRSHAIPPPAPVATGPAAVTASHASAPSGDHRPAGDAARSWASYLLAARRPEAEEVLAWLQEQNAISDSLRSQWVEYLVTGKKDYRSAVAIWARAHTEPSYPDQNRVFNSRFQHPLRGGRMDWTLSPHPHVKTSAEGGLTLTFDGKENTAYGHLSQQCYLPAGRWRFTAGAECDGLTTGERPFFRIYDTFDPRRLEVSTPMAPAPMTVEFQSPAGGSWVTVMLQRRQTEKFDSKIAGTLRLREVKIERADGGA